MDFYPNTYCIKCKKHTETLGKHTLILSSKRRVLKGTCPLCSTETYRFMPKKGQTNSERRSLVLLGNKAKIGSRSNKGNRVKHAEVPVYSHPLDQLSILARLDIFMGSRMTKVGFVILFAGISTLSFFFLVRAG